MQNTENFLHAIDYTFYFILFLDEHNYVMLSKSS